MKELDKNFEVNPMSSLQIINKKAQDILQDMLKAETYRIPETKIFKDIHLHPTLSFPQDFLKEDFIKKIQPMVLPSARVILLVDGYFVPWEKLTDVEPIAIQSLATIMKTRKEAPLNKALPISHYFNALIPKEYTLTHALNTAYLQDGAYIYIPANVSAGLIQFLCITTQPGVHYSHNVVVLEENSQVQCIETYVSFLTPTADATSSLSSVVQEFFIAQNAQLELHLLYDRKQKERISDQIYISQAKQSKLISSVVSLGGEYIYNKIENVIEGEEASCNIKGLYKALKQEQHYHYTDIQHHAPKTYSQQEYRGIISDKAKASFRGRIFIKPHAQQVITAQKNQNLLLSSEAEIYTQPELEIYANDVKCAHGASVGQLDPAVLFYLKSRGLEKAEQMLLNAFLQFIFKEIHSTIYSSFLKKSMHLEEEKEI